jgi:hypothetical protein
MNLPSHVVDMYQSAAVQACYQLGINPYEFDPVTGQHAWMKVAMEMHKMNVMRHQMMAHGMLAG